ncbi:MAG: PKD domain-containing protein [candidate division KSB1 bacterium]|nr:PKD domain-containing protein [candidate division KSB1 bacterium]
MAQRIRTLAVVLWIVAFLTMTNSYSQVKWSDEIFITQGNTPDLVIDPATGQLHLTAMTNNGVKYVITDRNGKVLHQEMVPGTENDRGLWRFGASLAIDSNKMPHIGFRENEYDNYYDVFYTYKKAGAWTSPLKIADNVYRGYVVRLAIDGSNRVHFAHGSVTDLNTVLGPINYYIIQDNKVILSQNDIQQIRGDERFELDVTSAGIVELVSGDFSYPPEGGPIFYWRSGSAGGKLVYRGDIHDSDARGGANGSPDLFIDASGKVHVCYGAELDNSVINGPTVRYARIENGNKVRDTRVTANGELTGWKIPVGVASLAASEDGSKIVVAYLASETGPLYARLSENGGLSWGEPVRLADGWNTTDARNKHIVRAYRSNFYVIYPATSGIKLRYLKLTINQPPVAEVAGPYKGTEGSAIQFDASKSSDPDGAIVSYLWDFQNDGKWDDTTTVPTSSHIYPDDFNGMVKIKVIDSEDDYSLDSANVTISNIAPTAEAGGPYNGKWNQMINFIGSATDPSPNDALVLTYEWDLDEDGIFETVGKNVQRSYSAGEKHKVWLRVKDDDGGVGLDSALVTIANEPPVVSQIPNQSIRKGGSFNKINLDDYVADPDNLDDQIRWKVSGVQRVNVNIVNRVAEVSVVDQNWVGSDTVLFIATDPGDRSDTSATVFTVTPSNQRPVITAIPEQIILENEQFAAVHLDNYVTDPDNADDQLSWSFRGNNKLMVSIIDRILKVAVPDSEWAGTEVLTLVVADPEGLRDSTKASFTVIALNDPPVVTRIPDQRIRPGETFRPIRLDDYVFDIDNKDEEIQWSAFGALELVVSITNRIATITVPNSEWQGSETIIFYARDPYGATGSSITTFTVSTAADVSHQDSALPAEFALYPNYPNPFNPETTIGYDVPKLSHIRITIYNRLGQRVRTLVDQTKPAGRYKVIWDGTDDFGNRLTSGVYFYRLETDGFQATRKMIYVM